MDMDFLNDIGEKARAAAVYAGEKAKSAAETAKLNVLIVNEQHNMDKSYKAIGEWFVAEHKDECPDAIRDMVEAIKASQAKIAEYQAQKGDNAAPKRACPVCGTMTDGRFCPSCGADLGENE